jgi:Phytochelatin synthase
MLARLFRMIAVLALLVPVAQADSLPLPPNLIASSSQDGGALLVGADAREAYFTLVSNYVTQQTQSFCGVASMVMVFNAMQLPAPEVPAYAPYRTFTQDNVLDARTDAILPRGTILKQGITLDQMGALLGVQPVDVTVRHASDASADSFRSEASSYLAQPGHFVLVNYLRKTLGQQTGGHFSPLAAYDKETDRFLILDVARYKYPPVWVKADELFAAMNTKDSDNDDKSRGYVLISRKS